MNKKESIEQFNLKYQPIVVKAIGTKEQTKSTLKAIQRLFREASLSSNGWAYW